MNEQTFKYCKNTQSIRLMPHNYCVLIFLPDLNRWIIDCDRAIDTETFSQIVTICMSADAIGARYGEDGERLVKLLNEKTFLSDDNRLYELCYQGDIVAVGTMQKLKEYGETLEYSYCIYDLGTMLKNLT